MPGVLWMARIRAGDGAREIQRKKKTQRQRKKVD